VLMVGDDLVRACRPQSPDDRRIAHNYGRATGVT
jgi:hypothetical protein